MADKPKLNLDFTGLNKSNADKTDASGTNAATTGQKPKTTGQKSPLSLSPSTNRTVPVRDSKQPSKNPFNNPKHDASARSDRAIDNNKVSTEPVQSKAATPTANAETTSAPLSLQSKSKDADNSSKNGEQTSASAPLSIQSLLEQVPDNEVTFDEAAAESFVRSVNILRDAGIANGGNDTLIEESMKNIIISVQDHPIFSKILLPTDIGLLVRFLQKLYHTAIVKKDNRSEKAKTKAKAVSEVHDLMGDVDLGLGNAPVSPAELSKMKL